MSEPHYAAHWIPVWSRLKNRGKFYAHNIHHGYLVSQGVPERDLENFPNLRMRGGTRQAQRGRTSRTRTNNDIILVAASGDYQSANRHFGHKIFVEHGCGISYGNRHPSYAGGTGRRSVGLFLCPNEYVAKLNRQYYPAATSAIVGDPYLDKHMAAPKKDPGDKPLVVISFHWPAKFAAEAGWAFPEYEQVLPELAKRFKIAGHCHPRVASVMAQNFRKAGIPFIADFDRVMLEADIYAVDNSSTLYEFAATDRPVVAMNSAKYRRDVNHGLRFWEHSEVGFNCDFPADLADTIDLALLDPPSQKERRHAATAAVFPVLGNATDAAVDAIESWRATL